MNEFVASLDRVVTQTELLERVIETVRIPSWLGVPGEQEKPVAEYFKALFDAEGIECSVRDIVPGRSNVTARLPGAGGGKTLLLTGHLDTVGLKNMPRGCEPWLEDGKLYGRGTSDMKGPDVCMSMTLVALKRAGIRLKGDLLFAGVADEEMCSLGTVDLIEQGIHADGAVVGEPTDFAVCRGHRGLEWYEFHIIGKTVHGGSQSQGVNAITQAMKFVNAVETELKPRVFAKRHELLKEATLNVGIIQGGTGLSTVPGDCRVWIDRRFLPYESYDEVGAEFQRIIDRLHAQDPTFQCEMKVMDVSVMKPGFVHMPMETAADHPLVKAAEAAVAAQGKAPEVTFFPAWTDAGLLNSYAHIPCVVLGPGLLENCHSEREYIPVEHLARAVRVYGGIAADFCGLKG